MFDFWTNPLLLRGLSTMAMAKAFLRYRNPRRRAVGKRHVAFYEETWADAATLVGAKWTALGSGIGEIERDGHRTRVLENVTGIDDPVTLAVLHDKPLCHRILLGEGLSVPRHARFTLKTIKSAVAFLKDVDCDCVVKPASGTGGGRGVTTGVKKLSHLAKAAALAAVYGDDLMIEEQITGDNYRLLYLDGELIDAYVRRLPSVVGDGRSSVSKLVQIHNDERSAVGVGRSQVLLTVDLDLKRTLAKQGLSLRSVPRAGQRVTLKTVVNENCGDDNETVMRILSPSIVADGARAARALRGNFIGIDLVTPDCTVPLAESGGVILEINGTPNLYYHYHKKDGAFPVAINLLNRLLPQVKPTAHHGTTSAARSLVSQEKESANV